MKIEPLPITGAWVCTPQVHGDDRGRFLEWFRGDLLAKATGRRVDVVQANHSVSRRGVVRGIHFADVPPGQAKLVYCPAGSVVDVIVDVRVGSPTFGQVEPVVLDQVEHRAVFIAEGLGHAFCALEDDTSVNYLVSTAYNPSIEHAVSPREPALQAVLPADLGPLTTSARDEQAPSLAEAARQGLLPTMDACAAWYDELR
jgi:dTDP-4-dehydrorhamnose 3,5-epimerase